MNLTLNVAVDDAARATEVAESFARMSAGFALEGLRVVVVIEPDDEVDDLEEVDETS